MKLSKVADVSKKEVSPNVFIVSSAKLGVRDDSDNIWYVVS